MNPIGEARGVGTTRASLVFLAALAACGGSRAPVTPPVASVGDAGPGTDAGSSDAGALKGAALVDLGEGWDHANVFSKPGYEGPKEATLERGAKVEILGTSEDGAWCSVRPAGGEEGWLSVGGRPSSSHDHPRLGKDHAGDAACCPGDGCGGAVTLKCPSCAKDAATVALHPDRTWWLRVAELSGPVVGDTSAPA
jgi:hypothetical protein